MISGRVAVILCLVLGQSLATHETHGKGDITSANDHEDHVQNIRHVLSVIQENSHLVKIAERTDIPDFHLETFRSLEYDNDRPCQDAEHEKYRRPDGLCNNLRHPFRGASMDTGRRLFTNYYLDGRSFPRVQGIDLHNLPSAREVSLKCFGAEEDDDGPGSQFATQLVWQFGQLLAHDMTLMERFRRGGECCDGFRRDAPYDALYHGDGLCFPIEIPPEDPYFNETCMLFTRTFAADVYGVREAVNGITSYIDGSTVYGASIERTRNLRQFVQGLLKTSHIDGFEHFPNFDNFPCIKTEQVPHCHGAGDSRVSAHPGLITSHLMFHLDHNRIARRLFDLNRHWDDETLFQESRKILTGIFQKIVWEDFLPILVGDDVMRHFRLKDPFVYDDSVDAGAMLEFTVAACRYGHSMINTRVEGVEIAGLYFRPLQAKHTVTVPFYMAHNSAQDADKLFTSQVRDHMYDRLRLGVLDPAPGPGFDLPALNIQRGRDVGVPPYSVVRDTCLRLMKGIHGARNETPECLADGVYRHEEDIDLFVGGISETPLPDAVLGPTFACLTALQFQKLRFGDRFFYESEGPEGFTHDQRQFIRRNTLASIICELNPNAHLQRDAFRVVSASNPLVPCRVILAERDLDTGLELWKDAQEDDSIHPLFSDLTPSEKKHETESNLLKILH